MTMTKEQIAVEILRDMIADRADEWLSMTWWERIRDFIDAEAREAIAASDEDRLLKTLAQAERALNAERKSKARKTPVSRRLLRAHDDDDDHKE